MFFWKVRLLNTLKCAAQTLHIQRYHLPANMKCLQLNKYGSTVSDMTCQLTAPCPTENDLSPDQALIKVYASSINPFDIEMCTGYGRSAINVFRRYEKTPELPVILGRDCSGVIIKRGKRFRRFRLGDSVCCVRWIVGQGTHAEYVIGNKYEISLKPKNINYNEATYFPYVACTTWNSLIHSGAVPTEGRRKRIFIPGGTGGIGSFATQLCQAFGHDVVTSCATDGIRILNGLGIQNVIDYTTDSYARDLKCAGPFDVILDTLNEEHIDFFRQLLKPDVSSKYVSLRPSLLPDMDKQGVLMGILNSGTKYLTSTANQLYSGKGTYHWGFFTPNAVILNKIRPLIEDGKIKPVIDKVFGIDNIIDAYKYVEAGHSRGKTVVQMSQRSFKS